MSEADFKLLNDILEACDLYIEDGIVDDIVVENGRIWFEGTEYEFERAVAAISGGRGQW